ncbi:hypothetical protein F511_47135 [Dorcoceras hygrometricum]|uniref:Uncharacterized protein n=1 Tax=Dorcoceras hygrometricum TaxID=472368 RepID=A0A2Z6ZZ33_9LAMI|nr:hypothetical protein F511_47135 [Dorcoceras hygrometricum]
MGPTSNIGPKTSWAARDRPELNLEVKFNRRNNLPEIVAGRRRPPPPTNRVRHSAALWQHDARPGRVNSGASRRKRAPIKAHWLRIITRRRQQAVGSRSRNTCVRDQHLSASQCAASARPLAHKRVGRGVAMPGGAVAVSKIFDFSILNIEI